MFGIYTELGKMTRVYEELEDALNEARTLKYYDWEIRDEETNEVIESHIVNDI